MAKPIIATNVSDIPEILDGCGWIVEPENQKQLAKTIKYVFDHPVEAKERGKKAREKCKKGYSWEAIEKKLTTIFKKYKTK
jgi:glycosyltransferase involved in cell wall biosynthesis